ncbi:NAD-dependent DNA ligase LigA [Lachnospiraceae bacterium NSJ-143]|nr:NAD-dependent DNA ligase LigA [Lachnospiraceae bacterium NSJ-143]
MDSMDRMKELVLILNEASKQYYQEASPVMTDYQYDKLYDELCELEKNTGVMLSASPTQKVGYTVLSALTKIRHEKRMLSLDKTKDIQKLKSWLGDNEGVLSWKLDGLTIVLKYKNGELLQAVTRGNGEIGEDITHNARVFKNIPLKISFNGELILRGEGVISYSEFERINETLPDEERYKNPRNLCSGTVRQLNSEIAADRKVTFYAFTLVLAEGKDDWTLKTEQMNFLEQLGFDVVESCIVGSENIEDTVKDFESRIEKNDFASDGLVLTYNSIDYSSSLGETSKFPKDSIAFKWADETAETVLREIEWSTSRTGLINPIAIFDPVELEGTTVNRASLHNLSIMEDLSIGVGDRIMVYKANMIIPQVAENLTKSGSAEIPLNCPVCGGETEIRKLRDGKALYCTNPNCHAQRVMSLAHFVSRDAMNIEGLSEETIKKFIDNGFVDTYVDVFRLERFEEEIKSLEGFGEKSYSNLINSVEKSKNAGLANFIYALGINHVGLSNAKLLCRNFENDIQKIFMATEEEINAIDGFGEIIAHSIHSYFNNDENKKLLTEALKYITFRTEENISAEAGLSGLTFVITGDLESYNNRKELQNQIESMGGKVTGSVTKKTSFLINNDAFSESSKNKKAAELGVPVITENEFITRFINK